MTEPGGGPLARVTARIETLTAADVRAWLTARLVNCERIAATKYGADRDGWLDDAAYFAGAIGLIDWTEAIKEDKP